MGRLETCAVDNRIRFVAAVERGEETMSAVCRRFRIARKTGYAWLARYGEAGIAGLTDRSRAPLTHPQAVAAAIAARCLAVRHAHPTWGPRKVLAWLERRWPSTDWPAASTVGVLFDREGLTVKRKRRRRAPASTAPFAACGAANDVWCIDFKGWFLTGDGIQCGPLTLSDAYSRYLLRCQVLRRSDGAHVWPVLDAAFRCACARTMGRPSPRRGRAACRGCRSRWSRRAFCSNASRRASRSRTDGSSGCT